jgi:CzcA family heavy metal efflux pump
VNWAEFSIRHKYTIFSIILAIILLGAYSYKTLKMELFPDTNPPLVNVVTSYPGVSAKDVADTLSKPMEEEFATITGVKKIKSTSRDGLSVVKVEFHYGINVDDAAIDVQNAISRIRRSLPAGIQEPQVLKFSTSDKPVLTYSLKSDQVDLVAVRLLAENDIKNELQLVEGVAAVDVIGGYKRQINIYVDKQRLDALNLSLDKVINTLRTQNITEPGGRVTQKDQEFSVRVDNEYRDPSRLGEVIVDSRNGNYIYLKDIARIEDSSVERRSEYRFGGENSIGIQIIKRDEANTVEVVERVKAKFDELAGRYPYITFTRADDDSIFTTRVVENMSESVRDALIFTSLIILFFLVALNESIVVASSMPLSLLATFALMKMSGMELNMVTLSAIILAVGIVVDDAIIVVENIMRHHHELGKDLKTAAIEGTAEIMLPDIAGTATIVIVMLPLLFVQGFVGRVFGPVAQTLIYAMLSSLFVSLTIIPLMTFLLGGKRWARGERVLAGLISPFTRFMEWLKDIYVAVLERALRARLITLGLAFLVLVVSVRMLGALGMDVLPKMDSGTFFISLNTYPGTSLQKTGEIAAQVEGLLRAEKEVVSYSTQLGYEPGGHYLGDSGALGVNQSFTTVNLTSRKEREETIWQIEERLRSKIARIPGIETFVVKETGGTAKSTTLAPVDVRIYGKDPQVLAYLAGQVEDKVKGVKGVVNVYKSWSLSTPQAVVHVDETRAAGLGLSAAAVAKEVFNSLEGTKASTFSQENIKDADIQVRYREQDRRSIDSLMDVSITAPSGIRVPLRDLATVEMTRGSNLVTRENLQFSIDVLGYTHERALSHVTGDLQKSIKEMKLPEGYRLEIAGEQSDLSESKGDMMFSLLLAVILVYLLLVAQFRSFIHPVTIMLAVPLVVIGVALALLISGKTISLPALLGLILLVGMVVRNSIVLLDYTLQARAQGVERNRAVVDSVKIRFRPIMMTAFSNVIAMLPLALEFALGAERFSPLAITVIGGITAATLLTMVVIPVAYTVLDDLSLFVTGNRAAAKERVVG